MKRNSSDTVIKYVSMETKEADAVYVDFMPQLWIVPMKKNVVLKERDCVNFSFPRRLPQQSKDSYIKFLKQAKFFGAVPDGSEKWDTKSGRILKMNLGSIEEALESQKLYSDFFSSTETEAATKKAPKKSAVRKKKKIAPKIVETSDSEEDDDRGGSYTVSNYNTRFVAENAANQSIFTLSQADTILPLNLDQIMDISHFEPDFDQFDGQQESIESVLIGGGRLSDLTNEIFKGIDVPTTIVTDQVQKEKGSVENQLLTIAQDNGDDRQTSCPQTSCCKGHQKVLNKIDYAQKKISKELSVVRQETGHNRQLLLQVLELLGQAKVLPEDKRDDRIDDIDGEPAHLDVDMAEVDEFNEKFNATFPIVSSEFIIEFNKSMKGDQDFADKLFQKLSKIKGENETKTVRKILKVLCGVGCLKDFTWQGTKKMKSFMDLHLIIELLSKLLEAKYPNCAAMDIISKVVKQRTKSAKERWIVLMAEEAKENATTENHSQTKEVAILTDQTESNNAADNTKPIECSKSLNDGTNQQITE